MGNFLDAVFKIVIAVIVFSVSPVANAADFETKILDNGTVLILVFGDIESGDENTFRRLSVEHANAVVILDSSGGKLMPAIEIGKIIRLAGYATIVGNEFTCTSSCALIWLAGSPRYLEPAGKIGFHASYRDNDGKLEETGVGNAVIGHYLSLLNLSQRAVVFATTASPTSILWLTKENSRESGIDFQTLENEGASKTQVEHAPIVPADLPSNLVKTEGLPKPKEQRTIADYSLDDMKMEFRSIFREPRFVEAIFSKMKLDPDSFKVMVEHAAQLYGEDAYIDRLAEEMHAAKMGFSGTDSDKAIAMSIGQSINLTLTMGGLSRLSDADVRTFIRYTAATFANASDSECRAIISGNDDFGEVEMRILTKLGKHSFAEYLAVTRRAILAELRNSPAKIIPSKVEIDAGEKSYQNHLEQQIGSYEESEQIRISSAIAALDRANDDDFCDAHYMLVRSIHDLGGLPGTWKRRSFINSLSE